MKYLKISFILCLIPSFLSGEVLPDQKPVMGHFEEVSIVITDKNSGASYHYTHHHPPIMLLNKEGHPKFLKHGCAYTMQEMLGALAAGFSITALLLFLLMLLKGESHPNSGSTTK